jgi:uncharacterized membrane protein
MRVFAGVLIVLVIATGYLYAHKGVHKGAPKPDSTARGDSTLVESDTLARNAEGVSEESERHPATLDFPRLALEHPHNKLVHFPIVLGLAAFVIALFDRISRRYENIILGMVVVGGLFSVVSVITGLLQSQQFIGTDQEWLVQYHKISGILLLLFYAVWAALLRVKEWKKYSWVVGCVTAVLILVTGFIGGVIAH